MNREKPTYETLEEKIKALESSVALNNSFLEILFDAIPSPIFYKDKNGVYINCNDAFSNNILGIPKGEIMGKTLYEFPEKIPKENADIYHQKDNELLQSHGTQMYESEVKCSDGVTRYYNFYKATFMSETNEALGIIGIMMDMTEIHKKEEELQNEKETFEAIFNGGKESIAILDMESNFLDVNPAYIEMTGMSKTQLLNTSCLALTHVDDIESTKKAIEEVLKVGYIKNFEKDCYINENRVININMSISIINNPKRLLINVRDVTDLKKTEEKLKLLASTDPMTKLYNRRSFTKISEHTLDLSKREKQKLSIIMLDIDKFKNINDSYGHQVGDDVIITLADKLIELQRKSDITCRYGGEEFVILLPNTSLDGAKIVAEKIRERIERLRIKLPSNEDLSFTISLGISQVDLENVNNIEIALKKADDALYEAKESGRNKVCVN